MIFVQTYCEKPKSRMGDKCFLSVYLDETISIPMNNPQKSLEERIVHLENEVNSLFSSLIAYKLRKPILEEVVELAVLKYFKVERDDFLGKYFVNNGRPVKAETVQEKSIIESRKWFLSIMRYVLRKTNYSLGLNYPFYHVREEKKHRPIFMGAIDPKSDKDQKNREILMGITAIIKQVCEEEGILSEDFQFL